MISVFENGSDQAVSALRVLIANQVRVDAGLLELGLVIICWSYPNETRTDGTYGTHTHLMVAEKVLDLPVRLFVLHGTQARLAVENNPKALFHSSRPWSDFICRDQSDNPVAPESP